MSDLTFTKIEQSIKDRKRLHLTFLKNVKTYAPFLELEEKAFADGKMDEAESQFIKALMIDDKNVEANYGLGEVYSETKEFNKLKDVLNTLLGLDEAFTYEHRQKFNQFGISREDFLRECRRLEEEGNS